MDRPFDPPPTRDPATGDLGPTSRGRGSPGGGRTSWRIPLRLRVVVLLTLFNGAVFGGGLAWITTRIDAQREQLAETDRELVIERLQSLLGRPAGEVMREVLAWPRWHHYEDAQIAQLRSPDPAWRMGLDLDLSRVARSGVVSYLPRGKIVPLYPPPRRGPVILPFPPPEWAWRLPLPGAYLPHPFSVPAFARALRPYLSSTWPRLEKHLRGKVWGAAFLPARFLWPWRIPSHLVFLGLSPHRQRRFEAYLSRSSYLTRAMRTAIDEARSLEIEGGVLLPLTNREGRRWGAAFLPQRRMDLGMLLPWNLLAGKFRGDLWPWKILAHASIYGLPEAGFGPPPVDAAGLRLNPLGAEMRTATFDQAGLIADLQQAARAGEWLESPRGLAVPLYLDTGALWGGVWLRPRPRPGILRLIGELLPWFLFSTVLLTLATLFGMSSLVLDPVRRLARGARRLATGDWTARIPEFDRSDELADLVRAFNTMAAQVEGFNRRLEREVARATAAALDAEAAAMTQRRLAATGELAAGIAHEINNPLGGMLNAIEVLERGELDPTRRAEYLELLRGGLERIGATVGGLLRLAPRQMRTEPVSLADPIGDALRLVEHRARAQGVRLVLAGEGGLRDAGEAQALAPWRALPCVEGQPNELGQAVLNLLVNALDAIEGEGQVIIGLEQSGEALHLWVEDDGPGMEAGVLPRAADLFFTTKETGRGTGLGLAIVHNVIDGHGGSVRMHNRPEGGLRVDIVLPLGRGGAA